MAEKGLLLLNLGSPESPSRRDVKRYLGEFLMDRYVIDIPAPLRYALVHGVITPFRSGKSAEAYASVWTKNGSALTHTTRTFSAATAEQLKTAGWDVRWGMRYGHPNARETVKGWKVKQLYVVPLYPQYAESSTRSAVENALSAIRKEGVAEQIFVLQDFYGEPEFIEAQAAQIASRLESFQPDVLLLSFHGLPEHHLTKLHDSHCLVNAQCCDTVTEKNRLCYRAQAMFTAQALRARLPFSASKIKVGFQSRLGRRPWIKPYTDIMVTEMAKAGVKKILVSCPSFVADCLETLEEIEIRLREQFISEGGEDLQLVPALNVEPLWVKNFATMISRPDLKWQTTAQKSHFLGL